jgi:hypothetical protein
MARSERRKQYPLESGESREVGVAKAARASAGYDMHQRVVVRSRVIERFPLSGKQRRARCETRCEE